MQDPAVVTQRALTWLRATPNRTFIFYPLLVLLVGRRIKRPEFLWLLPWGYVQYRLVGNYRRQQRAGGPGLGSMPQRLLTSGPYRFTRNPMYLGHLIFLGGLALSSGSKLAWAILLASFPWYQQRVAYDEQRLRDKFGAAYEDYCRRVPRWF